MTKNSHQKFWRIHEQSKNGVIKELFSEIGVSREEG